MSIITGLTQRNRSSGESGADAAIRCLTDGYRLFRRTSAASPAGCVWLEDCQSLTVVLATADEVGALAAVCPTDEPEGQGRR